jgi:SAM-dependent methyltransferase
MSEADRLRWDARWRERGADPGEPSVILTSLADLLPSRGRALDVGGGAGRHALWLARRGLDVTVTDISPVALEAARTAAAREGLALHTAALDLEREPLPQGPWDVVLAFHYFERAVLPAMAAALAPGGVLVIVQPTQSNLQRHAHPSARFLLDDGELARLVPSGLGVVRLEEGWLAEGRHEAVLVARRADTR